MSQDSQTSHDITYSVLLRDAKIEIIGIAHFYSCYLCIKSYPDKNKNNYSISVNKEISEIVLFYKISTIFWIFCVFRPLNLASPHKFSLTRFSIVRQTHPYAGFPIVPIGSKVMADCRIIHHTLPCFFVRARGYKAS